MTGQSRQNDFCSSPGVVAAIWIGVGRWATFSYFHLKCQRQNFWNGPPFSVLPQPKKGDGKLSFTHSFSELSRGHPPICRLEFKYTVQEDATLPSRAHLPHPWSFSASFLWGQGICCWPSNSKTPCSDARGCRVPRGDPKPQPRSRCCHCLRWNLQAGDWPARAVQMDLKSRRKTNHIL